MRIKTPQSSFAPHDAAIYAPRRKRRRPAAVASLALALAFTLAACGPAQNAETASGAEASEPAAVTETAAAEATDTLPGTREQALALLDEIEEIGMEEAALDFTDAARIKAYGEKRGAVCEKLLGLELADADSAAQERLRSGAEKMLDYLGRLPDFGPIRGSGTQEERTMAEEITAVWASANGDFDSARAMLTADEKETTQGGAQAAGRR